MDMVESWKGKQFIYALCDLVRGEAWAQQRIERPSVPAAWQGRGRMYGNVPILVRVATAALPLRRWRPFSGPTIWFQTVHPIAPSSFGQTDKG